MFKKIYNTIKWYKLTILVILIWFTYGYMTYPKIPNYYLVLAIFSVFFANLLDSKFKINFEDESQNAKGG